MVQSSLPEDLARISVRSSELKTVGFDLYEVDALLFILAEVTLEDPKRRRIHKTEAPNVEVLDVL